MEIVKFNSVEEKNDTDVTDLCRLEVHELHELTRIILLC